MDQTAPIPMSRRLGKLIGTFFGIGYLPVAPGTWGTFAAMPFAYFSGKLGVQTFALITVALAGVGIWAAQQTVLSTGREDPQIVVIDEVAGYFVTLLLVARDPLHLVLAFFLFRLLDILKPGPIRWLDRNVHGGLGVMLDDLAAGALGAAILFGLDYSGATAWIRSLLWS